MEIAKVIGAGAGGTGLASTDAVPAPGRGTIRINVVITTQSESRTCTALADADCWRDRELTESPAVFGGFLVVPEAEREMLANAYRLVLQLQNSKEIYRMILDVGNGRFVAHRL